MRTGPVNSTSRSKRKRAERREEAHLGVREGRRAQSRRSAGMTIAARRERFMTSRSGSLASHDEPTPTLEAWFEAGHPETALAERAATAGSMASSLHPSSVSPKPGMARPASRPPCLGRGDSLSDCVGSTLTRMPPWPLAAMPCSADGRVRRTSSSRSARLATSADSGGFVVGHGGCSHPGRRRTAS